MAQFIHLELYPEEGRISLSCALPSDPLARLGAFAGAMAVLRAAFDETHLLAQSTMEGTSDELETLAQVSQQIEVTEIPAAFSKAFG